MRTRHWARTERCRPTLEMAAGLPADLLDLLVVQDGGDAAPAVAVLDWFHRETDERSAAWSPVSPPALGSGVSR